MNVLNLTSQSRVLTVSCLEFATLIPLLLLGDTCSPSIYVPGMLVDRALSSAFRVSSIYKLPDDLSTCFLFCFVFFPLHLRTQHTLSEPLSPGTSVWEARLGSSSSLSSRPLISGSIFVSTTSFPSLTNIVWLALTACFSSLPLALSCISF